MKPYGILFAILALAAVLAAGCTSTGTATPATTTVTATVPETTTSVTTPVQTPTFTMGDHYLQKSYSFQSESEVRKEQIRVDNPSWGVEFTVLPLNENLQYCWFTITITNLDTGRTETYGYGRDNGYETYQQYPMYSTGPYTIEMKGNRVKVDLNIAKRNP